MTGTAIAGTPSGRALQAAELRRLAGRASGALLAIAILTTLAVAIIAIPSRQLIARHREAGIVLIAIGTIVGGFWVLWLWSKRNPLPAVLIGFVMFTTFTVLGYVGDHVRQREFYEEPSRSYRQGRLFGMIAAASIQISIAVALGRGIIAGVRHRRIVGIQRRR